MKLPTPSSLNFSLLLKNAPDIRRETFIFWGIMGMIFFQAVLAGWALYVLVATVLEERHSAIGPVRDILLRGEDIERVVGLLDERAEKFKEILEAE